MELFSERIKELRHDKGLTQKEIANVLNIRQQSYLRYEKNTGEPSLQTLKEIALFYDVSIDYLLGLED